MSRRRRLSILLHRWHRRVGVLASVFLMWMVVSGWLLNHSAGLHLAQSTLHANWLAQRYGIQSAIPSTALSTTHHWLVAAAGALLLDGKPIAAAMAEPLGVVESGQLLFIASATQLQILSAEGALVDTVPVDLLPIAKIERLGSGCGGAVIAAGEQSFSSPDGVAWQPCAGAVVWSAAAPLTAPQREVIAPLLQPGVSAERLLLDLHSGRLLGHWGPYFIDAVGFGLVLLALSGVWMFSQQRRRQRQQR